MDIEGGTKAINNLHGKAISKNGRPLVVELSHEVSPTLTSSGLSPLSLSSLLSVSLLVTSLIPRLSLPAHNTYMHDL